MNAPSEERSPLPHGRRRFLEARYGKRPVTNCGSFYTKPLATWGLRGPVMDLANGAEAIPEIV
jgi:hypothetical protein